MGNTHSRTNDMQDETPTQSAKHLALLGRVGHGKSSFGNTLFGAPEFKAALSSGGVTEKCLTKEGCWKGDEDFELVCISGLESRVPEELLRIMRDYERLLGKAIWQHCIIVVTNCDPIPAYKA